MPSTVIGIIVYAFTFCTQLMFIDISFVYLYLYLYSVKNLRRVEDKTSNNVSRCLCKIRTRYFFLEITKFTWSLRRSIIRLKKIHSPLMNEFFLSLVIFVGWLVKKRNTFGIFLLPGQLGIQFSVKREKSICCTSLYKICLARRRMYELATRGRVARRPFEPWLRKPNSALIVARTRSVHVLSLFAASDRGLW